MTNVTVSPDTAVEVSRSVDGSAVQDAVQAIKSGNALAYSSIKGDDFDTKLSILEAITDSLPVGENLGKLIMLKDVIIQLVQFTDEATGEVSDQPRIIFLDVKGVAYHATSTALLRGLNSMFGLLGEPDSWPADGVPVKFVTAGKAPRAYFTVKYGKAAREK